MRANVFSLKGILEQRQQWVVPVYQRHYEWEVEEGKQLPKIWDDLRENLEEKAIERPDNQGRLPHYFGAIISYAPGNQAFGVVPQRFLVDGQQRITTFQLMLSAMRWVAHDHQLSHLLDVIDSYIHNEHGSSMADKDRERFKLWPSNYDRKLYQDIVKNAPGDLKSSQQRFFFKNGKIKFRSAGEETPKLLRAYWFLYQNMSILVQERKEESEAPAKILSELLDGIIKGFNVVLIELDPTDDAQEIFASLNGLGKPLSPFDIIRNDVFHRAQKANEDSETLFDEKWQQFEQPFWTQQVRQGRRERARADHLIAHTVVAETAREVNVGKVSAEYQQYVREYPFQDVSEELEMLLSHASTYRAIEEKGGIFAKIGEFLQLWDMSTFHPLILWINAQPLEDDDKCGLLDSIEAYIVRRELCGLTSKNYNKVVTGVIKYAREQSNPLIAVIEYLSSLSGDASRIPADAEVEEECARRSIDDITRGRLYYILQQIEHEKRTKFHEAVLSTEDITVEHVMPKHWKENWPLPNGTISPYLHGWETLGDPNLDDETKRLITKREKLISTLGNLTLITGARNTSIGNASWELKREHLSSSLLALNREVVTSETWDEAAIERRTADLAQTINKIWKRPIVPQYPTLA